MLEPTYEESMSRAARFLDRTLRHARWLWKRCRGIPRSIVVETRWRLGDEVMTLPVLAKLGETYPKDSISVWCTYPVIFNGAKGVTSINDFTTRPDRYICLRDAPRRVPRREHYAALSGLDSVSDPPVVVTSDARSKLVPDDFGPYLVFAPDTTWQTKHWPAAHWTSLAASLGAQGRSMITVGSETEISATYNLAGKTSVSDLLAILRGAQGVVSCDSGVMHLALAMGTPVIGLFGPTDPAYLILPEKGLTVLRNGRACQGCWNHLDDAEPGQCPLAIKKCMETLSVHSVMTALDTVLEGACASSS